MKLERLSSSTGYRARKVGIELGNPDEALLGRVGHVEIVDPDREQSLREQMREAEATAALPEDQATASRNANELALDIVRLGPDAQQLIKVETLTLLPLTIDEKA